MYIFKKAGYPPQTPDTPQHKYFVFHSQFHLFPFIFTNLFLLER